MSLPGAWTFTPGSPALRAGPQPSDGRRRSPLYRHVVLARSTVRLRGAPIGGILARVEGTKIGPAPTWNSDAHSISVEQPTWRAEETAGASPGGFFELEATRRLMWTKR